MDLKVRRYPKSKHPPRLKARRRGGVLIPPKDLREAKPKKDGVFHRIVAIFAARVTIISDILCLVKPFSFTVPYSYTTCQNKLRNALQFTLKNYRQGWCAYIDPKNNARFRFVEGGIHSDSSPMIKGMMEAQGTETQISGKSYPLFGMTLISFFPAAFLILYIHYYWYSGGGNEDVGVLCGTMFIFLFTFWGVFYAYDSVKKRAQAIDMLRKVLEA